MDMGMDTGSVVILQDYCILSLRKESRLKTLSMPRYQV
jgi:hypothetical protein